MVTQPPTTVYGVWIHGQGWLKKDGDAPLPMRVFASPSKDLAAGAAALWGVGAQVQPIDNSLIELESVFVGRDQQRQPAAPERKWWRR